MSLSIFNDVFDDFFSPADVVLTGVAPRQRNVLTRGHRNIATDFVEKDANFELRADLPGLTKEDIKVDVDGDVITIGLENQERHERKPEEGLKLHRVERTTQYRNRAMRLPDNADTSKIDAKYENGVLILTIPKKPAAENTKRIAIT